MAGSQISQNNRYDTLILIRNGILADKLTVEINHKMLKKEQLLTADLNPNISTHIKALEEKITNIDKTLRQIDSMIDEEGKQIN